MKHLKEQKIFESISQQTSHEMLNMLSYLTDTAQFLDLNYDTREEILQLVEKAKKENNELE